MNDRLPEAHQQENAGDVSEVSEDELVQRSGASPERARELRALGILGGGDAAAPFRAGDAMRVQLVDELEACGIPASRIAEAISDGALSLAYLDLLPEPPPRSDRTYAEACAELGVGFGLFERVYTAFGLPRPEADERLREDDLRILSGLSILFEAGLREAEVLRAARVWSEGVRRVAQHQVHSFHELIEEPFRRRGLSGDQAFTAALSEVGVRLIPYANQLVGWLYARHFERAATEHRLGHVEAALDSAGLHRTRASHPPACVFADLSGSTQVTEELGDDAAASMALDLAVVMQDVAERHEGLVVKMLGDGVHFHFGDPTHAVHASLDFVELARARDLPPAHVGVEAGPMTYTDGDYYGLTVIIAARIASQAAPSELLVGEGARAAARSDDVAFQDLGPLSLKGVMRPVRVYRAQRRTA